MWTWCNHNIKTIERGNWSIVTYSFCYHSCTYMNILLQQMIADSRNILSLRATMDKIKKCSVRVNHHPTITTFHSTSFTSFHPSLLYVCPVLVAVTLLLLLLLLQLCALHFSDLFMLFILQLYCPIGIYPMGNLGCFSRGKSAGTESRFQPTVHAGCFSFSIIHRTLTWTAGPLTCAQM